MLNEYLSLIAKVSIQFTGKHTKSHNNFSVHPTQSNHQHISINTNTQEPYNPFKSGYPSHKKNLSGVYQVSSKVSNGKMINSSSFKEKTPIKKNKGH